MMGFLWCHIPNTQAAQVKNFCIIPHLNGVFALEECQQNQARYQRRNPCSIAPRKGFGQACLFHCEKMKWKMNKNTLFLICKVWKILPIALALFLNPPSSIHPTSAFYLVNSTTKTISTEFPVVYWKHGWYNNFPYSIGFQNLTWYVSRVYRIFTQYLTLF